MKKTIIFLITLFNFLLLSGCTTISGTEASKSSDVLRQERLATDILANSMQPSDLTKLEEVINTARPRQVVSWKISDGNKFEFTSLKVFLNEQGEPCRSYLLKKLGLFEKKTHIMVACRNNQGKWAVDNSAQPYLNKP